ncbi:acyltransferase family protein [Vibrio maerlii]|uniref:acyltransferase family protein n=1 Tax=Vibrio maerlii TaxID=2231648 RepID=UPI000E3D116A|nr:acyltransferase [Vibrio maerlii]
MNRNLQIDTLRGLACLLLVSYHVIGSNPYNGLRVLDGFVRDFNDILAYVRMPLFTFLSGLVYSFRPFLSGAGDFIIKKARRLLLPMIFVGTTFAVLQYLTPGSNDSIQSWYLIHILPVAHFWFIESLFLLFLIVVMLEATSMFSSIGKWALITLISIAFYLSSINIVYFSLNGLIYLMPYFLIGMGVNRYKLISYLSKTTSTFILISITLLFSAIYFGFIDYSNKRELLPLIVGMLSCSCLLALKLESKLLASVGSYSYSIYLYHVFFTAFSRIVLLKLGLGEYFYILFMASLFMGVIGPILIELTFKKYNITRVLFLGMPKKKLV